VSHNEWPRFQYVLLKNEIYDKMQREKPYNLQSKAYFNCILFVFKKSKTLCDQFLPLRKKSFLSKQMRNFFFLISSFYHRIHFIKKEIYHEMQREKLYNLQRTVCLNCVLFVFKILCDQFSPLRKLIAQNFAFFKNKK